MPSAGFEQAIQAIKQLETYCLEYPATGLGSRSEMGSNPSQTIPRHKIKKENFLFILFHYAGNAYIQLYAGFWRRAVA